MTTERWQEIVLALAALLWGALLALPDDVLGRVRAYAAINRFLPDAAWAGLLCSCALVILIAGRRAHGAPGWRAQAHLVLGLLWLAIVYLIFSSGVAVTGILVASPFVAMAALHIFEFLKLSQLARL